MTPRDRALELSWLQSAERGGGHRTGFADHARRLLAEPADELPPGAADLIADLERAAAELAARAVIAIQVIEHEDLPSARRTQLCRCIYAAVEIAANAYAVLSHTHGPLRAVAAPVGSEPDE